MPRYRYVTTTEGQADKPLAQCLKCGKSLTEEGGITIEATSGVSHWHISSRLNERGTLEDPDGDVEDGHHSMTYCGHCMKPLIDMDEVEELDIGDDERVAMHFDEEEAKGQIELVRHGWGADLLVDGVQVAFIDLFPKNEGDPAQLLIGDGPGGENLAKIVLVGESKVLVVHKDAKMMEGQFKYAIHSKPVDFVFKGEHKEE